MPNLNRTVLGLAALTSVLLGAGACRDQQSFVVVTVDSSENTPITGVVDLVVVVTNDSNTTQLTYPVPADQSPLTITNVADPHTGEVGKTFSVSFTIGRTDSALFHVTARDASHCIIAVGENSQLIKRGGVTNVLVHLDHAGGPCDGMDGGGADAPAVFPGCDPATISCSAGLTCAVNCAALQGQCVVAGTTAPSGLCEQGNASCSPGSQCFTYSGQNCSVPVCLKFCKTNSDCATTGSNSAGTTSVCQGNVSCPIDGGVLPTGYHTCTFACDPRGAATGGCPAGLHCFVVDTMDQVDCTCTEATRTHTEGQSCTRGVDCLPGLICDLSTAKCQRVCRRGSDTDCATAIGKTCTALTSDQIFGVCL